MGAADPSPCADGISSKAAEAEAAVPNACDDVPNKAEAGAVSSSADDAGARSRAALYAIPAHWSSPVCAG